MVAQIVDNLKTSFVSYRYSSYIQNSYFLNMNLQDKDKNKNINDYILIQLLEHNPLLDLDKIKLI
jgi:hypothetical protein